MDRQLKWFLVEYDRHEQKLHKLTAYDEPEQWQEANGRLAELEESQASELQRFIDTGIPLRMEYVLLLAESEEAIRVTHGNYFGDDHLTLDEYREIVSRREAEAGQVAAAD